ncbi:hypothetical protein GUJ93_ZPchr0458g22844 [Zizania palustris]|uniref:Uncharacterized protein n=1 Tax=Zizania palustris TaxID=103762 RepID=A0A8J5VF04_ZIZPA|nr:hypothetical protein GUJ93_ZPchr0458g22844 [Zizania palustris]
MLSLPWLRAGEVQGQGQVCLSSTIYGLGLQSTLLHLTATAGGAATEAPKGEEKEEKNTRAVYRNLSRKTGESGGVSSAVDVLIPEVIQSANKLLIPQCNFLVSKEPPHKPILLDFGLTKRISQSMRGFECISSCEHRKKY